MTVRYPWLAWHPRHERAKRQPRGFSTVISLDVTGDAGAADEVCARVKLVLHAASRGVEDLWTDLAEALARCGCRHGGACPVQIDASPIKSAVPVP